MHCLVIYIFVNPFSSCVTDRYQHKQCIIMETEMCIEILLVVCATCCYIFGSGLYTVFMEIEGPSHDANPGDSNALDYLSLLWPATLRELIALETNRYALQRGVAKWRDVSTAEIWTFLGIVILMGIKRLPRISNYWSRDRFIGVPGMNQYISAALSSSAIVLDKSCPSMKPW